ncbi:MAG: hypothetical protein AAB150_14050 [Pseudomonadota bacterium]
MKTAIANIGTVLSGDWRAPYASGDAILMETGKIVEVGSLASDAIARCDVVIDAAGATAIPGLIDSQVHNTFGNYTPRQKTVGFLEIYVHGGVTSAISASEVQVTGITRARHIREAQSIRQALIAAGLLAATVSARKETSLL